MTNWTSKHHNFTNITSFLIIITTKCYEWLNKQTRTVAGHYKDIDNWIDLVKWVEDLNFQTNNLDKVITYSDSSIDIV